MSCMCFMCDCVHLLQMHYVWQFFNKIVGASLDSSFYELFVRNILPSISNVISNRHAKENWLLRYDSDLVSKPVNI